jgi:hypothetical protein
MLDKKLKEALELIGGKAVVKDGEQYYVILSLKEFKRMKQEGISGLTKQELVDKINNDIASWKFAREEAEMSEIELANISDIKEDEIHYEKTVEG